MLYRPDAYDPLTETQWDEARVRDAIQRIVAATDVALRGPKLMWRAHPWDGWNATSPMKNLYVGGAGVLWGLDQLRRRGQAETSLDLTGLALRNLELFERSRITSSCPRSSRPSRARRRCSSARLESCW
jgi:hypothetical protein